MDNGLDYAGSSPGAGAVIAAGYQFVARYLSRYSSKTIQAPEYNDMTGNNVGVVLVFEDYANQALNGYQQGVADAQFALNEANGLGWPSNRPLYFAVDFDISDAQKPVAGAYMQGVISVLGLARVGAYGGYWWIKYCFDNGLATFGWQATAWSGGNRDPRAHIFQTLGGTVVNGTSCDVDNALQKDYGQNNYKGEDMATAAQIDDAIMYVNEAGWAAPASDAVFDNLRPYLANDFVDGIIQVLKNADTDPSSAKNVLAVTKQTLASIETQLAAVQTDDADQKTALAAALAQVSALQKQLVNIPSPTPVVSYPAWVQKVLNFFFGAK